ncbi:MAG: ABC transporter permease [bacterium]|nr:ABC transporter permease [bacterium]
MEKETKVLSPSMLVIKRFTRNRLAVIGAVIIVAMFIFSFLGGVISPYGETEVFRTTEITYKDYAGVKHNEDYIYTQKEGANLSALVKADMILAINKGDDSFTSGGKSYNLIKLGEDFYEVAELTEVAEVISIKGIVSVTQKGDTNITDEFTAAFTEADAAGNTTFRVNEKTYYISKDGRKSTVSETNALATASKLLFNTFAEDTKLSFEFKTQAELAMVTEQTSFVADKKTYQVELNKENNSAVFKADEKEYASASRFNVRAINNGVFLTVPFKKAVEEAIASEQKKFDYTEEDGTTETYEVTQKNGEYIIKNKKEVQVNATYQAPSKAHWMGTDGNGMDMLTRLMYGGRISLMIGFIVVIFEIILGVIVGGLSGYFGGWVDSICMRIVDIFNCIPSMPLYIILGAIMDFLKIDPSVRIYLLCVILAVLSWPQVARMVRGQILSLREQEFMIATEATGIRTSRRIFKHLIPNVIPQLIVIATMGLGNVILQEAALSFLGLGVKFPYASWGNIINAVNDIYIMTKYLFVWVPAGILILLTVLGFNFVGDGLRDAFDPKMKR